jgi:hypothetical protein
MAEDYSEWWRRIEANNWSPTAKELITAIRALVAENERLREALGPFAAEAKKYDPEESDDCMPAWESEFSLGDVRKARAALGETK